MASISPTEGHRSRLRQRFATDRSSFTETDLLELLLTYAVPRQDVSAKAKLLIQHFGSIAAVLTANPTELLTIEGVGEQSAALLQLVAELARKMSGAAPFQPALVDELVIDLFTEPTQPGSQNEAPESNDEDDSAAGGGKVHAFVNDEVLHSQEYLPQAYRFAGLDDFQAFLCERLPYNAATTRRRRANHIVKRFFPNRSLNIPLVEFLRQTTSDAGRDAAIFYHLLRSEPLLAKVAEELIWPALAEGSVEREDLRTFIPRYLPALSTSSQQNVLRSILTAYGQLGVATVNDDTLHIRLHYGDLDGFVYGLCAEFPQPGIYRFERLQQGLLRKGLLWDSEWIRRQLYLLQTLEIIAKVSEIDAVRQFTLRYDPWQTLRAYFALDKNAVAQLRENSDEPSNEYVIDKHQTG